MTKIRPAIVASVVCAGLFIGVNAAAAADVQRDVTGTLGVILLTNIGLIIAAAINFGVSQQRLRVVEKQQDESKEWQENHEKWADAKVGELRNESGERANSTERRLSAYQRADVLAPQLQQIFDRLVNIERELKIARRHED